MKEFLDSIADSNEAQRDGLWAILKYQNIGIYRKLSAMCEILQIEFDEIVDEMPQDDEGRIYDKKTRYLIHEALINEN